MSPTISIERLMRVAGKPKAYLARRALAEMRRSASVAPLAAARRGRGPLSLGRIVPGGAANAAAETAARVGSMAAWWAAPTLHDPARARALAAMDGLADLFGDAPVAVGRPPIWNRDPVTGDEWALAFYRSIDYRNAGRASDVKRVWELSRMRRCVALAQGAAVGEQAALATLEGELEDWHRHNPAGWSVNWTSAMEVALRAVNLICVDGILAAAGAELAGRDRLVASLYRHGWFLARNLEVSDVNGNHYTANAVGLVWLGRYFGPIGEAPRWAKRGAAMIRAAAHEQVLADGLDHEGSLPYHLLVLEMLLLARAVAPELGDIDGVLRRMTAATCLVAGPGGWVPDLGDDDGGRVAAFGDSPSRDAQRVLALAGALLGDAPAARTGRAVPGDVAWLLGPRGLSRLAELADAPGGREQAGLLASGGVAVLGDGDDRVVADVGPVGFRGRGGHGHLDALSFEARLGGAVVVRDSGTGSYTGDPALREELRDATAHSVVLVDGLSYAQLGGAEQLWTVRGDAAPRDVSLQIGDAHHVLRARQTLPAARGSAELERTLAWSPGRLVCVDRLAAPAGARVEHLLQVPDGVTLTGTSEALGPTARYRVSGPEAALDLVPCRASDRYGSVRAAIRLVFSYRSEGLPAEVEWVIEAR